ncbi:MAG: hypothetical protein ACLFQV_03875, partial [Vulcanimicrobiota bacterium]
AVYAGLGFPSLHFEVVRKARKLMEKDGNIGNLDRTSRMVQEIYQQVHGRMINDKLRYLLGFDRDEMNRKKFTYEGQEYKINQEAVLKEAKSILKYQQKADAFRRIFNNEGLVMGYDKANGIRAYHIDHEGRGLDFAYPFDAIGPGKEVGTKIFAEINSLMQLEERRKGFDFREGLFLLLNAFVESYNYNSKAGGYLHLFLIDGKKEVIKEMTREIVDHNSYLAAEVIQAYRLGYIGRDKAMDFVNALIIDKNDWQEVEAELFKASKNEAKLKKHLMGYRPFDAPSAPLA